MCMCVDRVKRVHQWDVGGGGGGREGVCGSEIPLIAAREIGGCSPIDLLTKLITRIRMVPKINSELYHITCFPPSTLSLSLCPSNLPSHPFLLSPSLPLPLPPPSKNLNRVHALYKYSGGQGHVPGQDKARCMCLCMHTSQCGWALGCGGVWGRPLVD